MAEQETPESIVLYGTKGVDEKGRVLRAGALSAEFDNGQLRYVRHGGSEMMRALAFIVRDEVWGTYTPEITGLEIDEKRDGFHIRYEGRCADGAVRYRADISGSERQLVFAVR